MLYLTKTKFDSVNEKGETKRVTEANVFDAVNFHDAEKRSFDVYRDFTNVDVVSITRIKIGETLPRENGLNSDKWFKCRLNFITLDEKSGKEKKQSCTWLVQAESTKEAESRIEMSMKQTTFDYTVEQIIETKIAEVFSFNG